MNWEGCGGEQPKPTAGATVQAGQAVTYAGKILGTTDFTDFVTWKLIYTVFLYRDH
jgi:hypothetical protein